MQRCKDAKFQREIVRTIAYSDIFGYPLSAREVWRFLIDGTEVKVEDVQKTLSLIVADCKLIDADREFYFLRGREEIVTLRQKKEKWSEEKIEIAHKVTKRLEPFFWVKMVGITGALAMENCDKDDDIDLMVVTSKNRLWLTRLLIFLLCPILGIERRKPKDKKVENKICFNLFLDEDHLKISPENLYLAHEICQVKPLLNKKQSYEKFLLENRWVKKHLPNAIRITNHQPLITNHNKGLLSRYLAIPFNFFEEVAYKIQCLYMKPKITSEKISLYQAFFHPRDLTKTIEDKLKLCLKSISLLSL